MDDRELYGHLVEIKTQLEEIKKLLIELEVTEEPDDGSDTEQEQEIKGQTERKPIRPKDRD